MYNREYLNLPSFIIITFLAGTTLMYGDYFSCNNILYRNYIYIILAFVITSLGSNDNVQLKGTTTPIPL